MFNAIVYTSFCLLVGIDYGKGIKEPKEHPVPKVPIARLLHSEGLAKGQGLVEDAKLAVDSTIGILPFPIPYPFNPCAYISCARPCYRCIAVGWRPYCVPIIKCPPCFRLERICGRCACVPDCRESTAFVKCPCPSCKVCNKYTGTCTPRFCPFCQWCNPALNSCQWSFAIASDVEAQKLATEAEARIVKSEAIADADAEAVISIRPICPYLPAPEVIGKPQSVVDTEDGLAPEPDPAAPTKK